jgi:hypothetical protein
MKRCEELPGCRRGATIAVVGAPVYLRAEREDYGMGGDT